MEIGLTCVVCPVLSVFCDGSVCMFNYPWVALGRGIILIRVDYAYVYAWISYFERTKRDILRMNIQLVFSR